MEETVTSKTLHRGKNFSFKSDQARLPSGKVVTRDIVDHPGAVAIIAMDEPDIILVKQYRYAAGRELLEVPAGTLEQGEDPDTCAVRELREETGYAARTWRKLLSCYMAPGYSNELIHFYVAEGLEQVGSSPEEDESINVERVSFDEALMMIEDNTIMDSKTSTGVLAYLTQTSP